ncbi:transposase [Roseivirga misakiensis]|uniref:Transposase n=1 Tax=Roseivirga misakiensis TaxID=1563681 RepID=A0A1E5SL63_9BACT|nr:transposase [Roseivirga misakiensis]OEJ99841.1 transposase [Roseivirga misakiensis]
MHTHGIQFFTATIYQWIPALYDHHNKQVIIDSLTYLCKENRVRVYGFVIMPNHIHLIWRISNKHLLKDVQRDFLKFTGQQIKFHLQKHNPHLLSKFEVNLKDRRYQFWQRNALSIDLLSRNMLEQKLNYIHANPVSGKWNLADDFVQYQYSSASFYEDNDNKFSFLRHYMECFGG